MLLRLALWLPALAIMAAIAYLSHQPDWPEAAKSSPDWLLHGSAYGALTLALWLGCAGGAGPPRAPLRCIAFAVLAAAVYGATDEWHQSFVPGRIAAVEDWLADVVGALVAGSALLWAKFAGPEGVWED